MSVSATHPEYDASIKNWILVRDVVDNNNVNKKYIKDIDANDPERNTRYKDDAVFVNFTNRTRNGLVGAVYRRHPEIELPPSIEYLEKDATGGGQGLSKLSKEITGEVLQSGRCGLLVDYPASQEGLTAAQVAEMNLAARMYKYSAESIINWNTEQVGGSIQLTLVVLKEHVSKIADDGFSWTECVQYRVLRMIDGVYTQFLYDEAEELINVYEPRDFNGARFTYIPFVFFGAQDNDSTVDSAPLLDLAKLNLGHLRNSADYEESVHIVGQPTIFLSTSMSAEEFKAANPNGVTIGARRGHNLGESGSASLLQANPNQLSDEAMKRKEQQAVMIGARLISQAGGNETAEAVRIKHSGENSVLSHIADNIEDGVKKAIMYVQKFMSAEVNEEEIVFNLNDQFFDSTLDPQMIMQQMQLLNYGIIAKEDIRAALRKNNVIDPRRTDEDIENDITNINPLA